MKFVKCLFACLFLFGLVSFTVGCGVSEEEAVQSDPLMETDAADDATGDDMLDDDPSTDEGTDTP